MQVMRLAEVAFRSWVPEEAVFTDVETRLTGNAFVEIRFDNLNIVKSSHLSIPSWAYHIEQNVV